tara:strand:+ start:43 stop:1212 length:1170 start_codon:yes stop_codon:yes gene_type:complete
VLSWEYVNFCGFRPPEGYSSLNYVVEVAEGHPFKSGVGSHFASGSDADGSTEYHAVHTSNSAGSLEVSDLEPGTWVHARLVVTYLNERFVSEPVSFVTDYTIPHAPACPRIYIVPEKSATKPSVERDPGLLLSWSHPKANGLAIQKFQVQFQETMWINKRESEDGANANDNDMDHNLFSPVYVKNPANKKEVEKEPVKEIPHRLKKGHTFGMPLPKSPSSKSRPTMTTSPQFIAENNADDEEKNEISDSSTLTKKWTNIFHNNFNKLKLKSPPNKAVEWKFRVRALNSEGWSSYSPILYMHAQSHPALFSLKYSSLNNDEDLRIEVDNRSIIMQMEDVQLNTTKPRPCSAEGLSTDMLRKENSVDSIYSIDSGSLTQRERRHTIQHASR